MPSLHGRKESALRAMLVEIAAFYGGQCVSGPYWNSCNPAILAGLRSIRVSDSLGAPCILPKAHPVTPAQMTQLMHPIYLPTYPIVETIKELWSNFVYGVLIKGDFLDVFTYSIFENNILDDLSQAGNSIQFSPVPLGAFHQHEHSGQDAFPRHTTPGLGGSEPHRGEGGLNRMGGPQMNPALGREVVEGRQFFPILLQTVSGLRVSGSV